MTNKQAKEIMLKLKEEITNDFDVLEDEEKEAFNKAIEALEQEPCEDMLTAYAMGVYAKREQTGHWIDKDEKSAVCSCCNRNNTLYGDFCKWCGARMERSDKE